MRISRNFFPLCPAWDTSPFRLSKRTRTRSFFFSYCKLRVQLPIVKTKLLIDPWKMEKKKGDKHNSVLHPSHISLVGGWVVPFVLLPFFSEYFSIARVTLLEFSHSFFFVIRCRWEEAAVDKSWQVSATPVVDDSYPSKMAVRVYTSPRDLHCSFLISRNWGVYSSLKTKCSWTIRLNQCLKDWKKNHYFWCVMDYGTLSRQGKISKKFLENLWIDCTLGSGKYNLSYFASRWNKFKIFSWRWK